MFEQFRDWFDGLRDPAPAGTAWRDEGLVGVDGYVEFADEFAGASFAGGLYRIHDSVSGPKAKAWLQEVFPEFARRATPFAYDWLGRQFAVDRTRLADGQPLMLLLEPGTGEALDIDASFVGLHELELVEYPDDALAVSFYKEWRASGVDARPLERDECAGYKIPLFLGGEDEVENLEVVDLEVYLSFSGQLSSQVSGLAPGTHVTGVEGE